ncbi:Concanavalin A-like lectin/glucanases superfamily protein [uncultured archaeon]|nr:Concanavalin A-like lectin/glucanases superfamily protein [uncultured archaeon]
MVFSFFGEKAQSTTEYLALVGLLVLVSLLVAGLVINQVDSSSSTFSRADNLGAVAGAFASNDFSATSSGDLYITIANHSDESITLSSITVDGVSASYTDDIDFDSKKAFKISGITECAGVYEMYDVSFSYISESGLTKTYSFGTLRVPCSNAVSLIETSVPVVVPEGEFIRSAFFHTDSNFASGSFNLTGLAGSNAGVSYDGNSKLVRPGNIVGLWHLNGNANDSSSGGNNGTWSGTELYTDGFWGTNAANFDSSSRIDVADNSNFDMAGTYTISFWINSTDTGDKPVDLSKVDGSVQPTNGWYIKTSNNSLYIGGYNGTEYSWSMNADGHWHHVVFSDNGTDLTVYIDDSVAGTVSGYSSKPPLNDAPLRFGGNTAFPGTGWIGKLEEIAIWDVALNSSEVTSLYDSWGFDSNFISPVYDTGKDSNFVSLQYNLNSGGVTTYSYGNVINPSEEPSLGVDLDGLWHLNNSQVHDSSTGENDGVVGANTFFVPALWDRDGVELDGTNSYVKIPVLTAPELEPSSAITLSIWAKRIISNSPTEILFAKPTANPTFWEEPHLATGYSHTAESYSYGFIVTSEAGALSFVVSTTPGGVPTVNAANASIPSDGLWHHLAGTYDGSTVKIYVDGALIDTDTDSTGNIYYPNPTSVAIGIGGTEFSDPEHYHGTLQEAAIWGRALSATEVKELFSKGASKLGIKYKGCSSADCSDGSWSALDSNISSLIDVTSIQNKRYFQYEVFPSFYTFEGSQQYPNSYPKFADLNFVYVN